MNQRKRRRGDPFIISRLCLTVLVMSVCYYSLLSTAIMIQSVRADDTTTQYTETPSELTQAGIPPEQASPPPQLESIPPISQATVDGLYKSLMSFIQQDNGRKVIEQMIQSIIPNYLKESSAPTFSNSVGEDSSYGLVENSYQFSRSTDENSPFKLLTNQQQNLLFFIVGAAAETYKKVVLGHQQHEHLSKFDIDNSDSTRQLDNYEQDLIRLKVKLFFEEIERNVKQGVSKDKIGWILKKLKKRDNISQQEFDVEGNIVTENSSIESQMLEDLEAFLEKPLYEEETELFKKLYPKDDECSKYNGVLFVGGLYTDWYPFYFHGLKKHLNECGMKFKISKVNSGGSLEKNALFLKNEIIEYSKELNVTKGVLIIGHSKGACDVAYALSKYENELKDHAKGMIALQAPYAGSALANDISEYGASKIALLSILVEEILGGELQAIEDLSYENRKRVIEEYPYNNETFPCISVSSHYQAPSSLLYPAISYLNMRYHVKNDGMVITMDGYIPGCKYIVVPEMDHSGGAFTGFPNLSLYDPAKLALTLVHIFHHYFSHKV
ncbi:hypothetical protein FDP41_006205 [Naegleria fowleri]|uniref:GPI inositol-deacylase n=1 Tax=Naegleria fowleri TaxID=5763 RepID=A0A6A5BK51_NAEFO|nr:uncharacterized protein FDP41_006205 [Naegleria fowleri]KAF0974731.1 hypothetical protein FDP41_006205 [Naegleria fowleri]